MKHGWTSRWRRQGYGEAIFVLVLKKILTIKIGERIGAAKLASFSEQFFLRFFFFKFLFVGIFRFFGGKKRVGLAVYIPRNLR